MKNAPALTTGLAALALATTLSLAGCGDNTAGAPSSSSAPQSTTPSPSTSTSVSAEFTAADVMFVQMMLPHHEQAVAMSTTLLNKNGVNPEVTALAEQITAAQQPEIDTMKSWLTAWSQQEKSDGGMGGMDHGSGADGMATDAQLKEFQAADGAAGQKMYLEMMTAHHQGAITMAQNEIRDGKNPQAIQLAKDIVATQEQEITVMKDLVAKL